MSRGVWTSFWRIDEGEAGEAARVAEAAGYGAFWLGGSPRLAQVRRPARGLREARHRHLDRQHLGLRPDDLAREYTELEADFPGRVCVGIGVGHPEATSDYKRPLSALEKFLDGVDAAARPIPTDRRIIAALGPKMLAMCVRRSLGTIPYFTSVDHTRGRARRSGPTRT